MKKDPCEFCDGFVEETVTRVPFHYRREIIYVDNVPVRVCKKCGELYFPAAVYKRLEKIAAMRKSIRTKISFPLADYRKALTLETR
ncbi:MAG TPA: YgiT-type zinc finger protein [Pyrinomonadaceae bacterium]|nr:YgiT-type zinc finger protein [Pyrinomonadaceae bacterium]